MLVLASGRGYGRLLIGSRLTQHSKRRVYACGAFSPGNRDSRSGGDPRQIGKATNQFPAATDQKLSLAASCAFLGEFACVVIWLKLWGTDMLAAGLPKMTRLKLLRRSLMTVVFERLNASSL